MLSSQYYDVEPLSLFLSNHLVLHQWQSLYYPTNFHLRSFRVIFSDLLNFIKSRRTSYHHMLWQLWTLLDFIVHPSCSPKHVCFKFFLDKFFILLIVLVCLMYLYKSCSLTTLYYIIIYKQIPRIKCLLQIEDKLEYSRGKRDEY